MTSDPAPASPPLPPAARPAPRPEPARPVSTRRLLYFSPSSEGGLADYAHEQANALADAGVETIVLCDERFSVGKSARYRRLPRLASSAAAPKPRTKPGRAWRMASGTLSHYRALAREIEEGRHTHVLLAAYAEYFSPLWAGPFRQLAGRGVRFGAVVHDPVRDTRLGPAWWHRRSVAEAYSFLQHAFVHEEISLETGRPVAGLEVRVVPHGLYAFPPTTTSPEEARRQLDLPAGAPVLLAFGHIRDAKNLDLLLRALAETPDLHLVVAGREQSSSDRPLAYYQALAAELGLAGRCRWHSGFIRDSEVGRFFAAADFVALTYSARFRSASGVLNAAAAYRKRCLASSGGGPLRTAVTRYDLGVFVEPDDADRLARGLKQLLSGPPAPRWEAYCRDHDWSVNAARVRDAFFATP